jgi:hypothetical protein
MINCDHIDCDEMAAYYVHESGYKKPFHLCMRHWETMMRDCIQPKIKECNDVY